MAVVLVLLLCVACGGAAVVIIKAHQGRQAVIVQRFNTRHTTASRFIEAYLRQILAQETRLAKQSLMDEQISQSDFGFLARLNQLSSAGLYTSDGARIAVYPGPPDQSDPTRRQDSGLESAMAGLPAWKA